VSAEIDEELRSLQIKAESLLSREEELVAANAKLAQENEDLRAQALQQLAFDSDAPERPLSSPFQSSPFADTLGGSPVTGAYYPPMSSPMTDATAKGSATLGSAGSPFGDELFFEPDKANSVTDPSVANPFLPDSSQGELANPFLQNSTQGTGDDVRSNEANDDLVKTREPEPILEVPEDREAEIAEYVARLVASLIMTAVISVSDELDKAFNDEVSNEGEKFMSTAILSGDPSSLLLTATDEMSPAQAAEKSSLYDAEDVQEEEDAFGGLGLARRSLTGVLTGMGEGGKVDVSGLDLESYDEEFEGDNP
jgi:hypothetical protein